LSQREPVFDGTDTFFEWPQNLIAVKKAYLFSIRYKHEEA
ncbi:hypothetical protein Lpp123_04716, partial [Lacticaseibacillus paracasei subsp. paracasei Lpp123]